VLDPFNGSGTTCVAAKSTGRVYIGVDLSEEYCTIAETRLESVEPWVAPEVTV
jgi:DNA modification methylase